MADNKILNKPSGTGFLSDLGKSVKGAAGAVVNEVKKDAGKVVNEVKKEVREEIRDVKAVVHGVDEFVKSVPKNLHLPSTSDLVNVGRDVLSKLYPQNVSDPVGQKYIKDTQDFRATVSTARELQGQLSGMSPSDPRYAGLKGQLDKTTAHLKSAYGYTPETAPKPGAVWVDPDLMSRSMPGGVLPNAKSFPTGKPVTTPPDPMDVVFRGGRSFTLTDAAGNKTVVSTPEQYKAAVAKTRAELGMPRTDGEPIAVHVSFEGGGGKGKRYGPAIAEMYRSGVVPASISGTSAGAIAAGLTAAGADPGQIDALMKSGELSKLYDINLGEDGGGVMDGKAAYDLFDRELRKLTGITDRPVTFADLKIPLQLVAAKMSDTHPPAGQEDMTQAKNRIFVFSQETTPNTPVALAMRASMSIPGAFDPVKMVDPASGRQVTLVDGGVFDNLPMHYNKNNLPNIGVTLMERDSNLASSHTSKPKPLPGGNLDATHILWNALNGYTLMQNAAGGTDDYNDRTQPKAGDFMLGLPTWDLTDPSKGDSTMGFGYDNKVDPKLDGQTRGVVQGFLKQFIADFGKPGASGTNTPNKLPEKLSFSTELQARGQTWKASYGGGNVVTFTSGSQKYDVHIGEKKIQAMYLDHMAFGDLNGQLGKSLNDYLKWATSPGARFGI
jgi:NTE family protein